ncbi:Ig-like domain-containing protein [Bifidobacterium oedipodis]|uniref:BIG2 domain-containing protein n=1 Tax=Bifidobacterium oedipodis TaxID=2675322 RepID=A0A7Y0HRB8_9BIFI|nr:Ig-like domain-containing protein [Bifidobacterium sp. DSM 109957]NMM93870.1 hypothetical protein [Bifidobacterium sp. DSM 109957]
MSVNLKSVMQPLRGTIFTAPAETELPDDLTQFADLTVEKVGDWVNLGHTSNDNKIEFSFDGGDPEALATWLMDNARTRYSDSTLTFTGNALQGDKDTVKLIYNGWEALGGRMIVATLNKRAVDMAFLVVAKDTAENITMGLYLPNVSFAFNGLPNFTGDNFAEFGFTGSVKASSSLPRGPKGEQGTWGLIVPEAFVPPVAVTGVTVAPTAVSVEAGKTATFNVTIQPSDATDTGFTLDGVDETKFTTSINGKTVTVTGVAETENAVNVTVKAKGDETKTATVAVTVTPKA